jgi:hypothetical protein
LASADALTFEREGEPSRRVSLSNEAVTLARAADSFWVLGKHGLYRLETGTLLLLPPASQTPAPTPANTRPTPTRRP